jgi:hypothetical protein
MKQVIDGLLYDTEADDVEFIAADINGHRGDFGFLKETLYKTASGNYFIHGEGGARTKYSVSHGNGTKSGGSEIRPLSEREALTWCEERKINGETIIREFEDHVDVA